jgi:hypothetical protein
MTVLKTFGLVVTIACLLLREATPFAVHPPNPRRGQSLNQGGRTHDGLLKVPSKDLPSLSSASAACSYPVLTTLVDAHSP